MFKYLFLFLASILTVTGCKNKNIEINGKLINPKAGLFLYLDRLESTKLIPVDSVIIKDNGIFQFIRKVEFPSFYLLRVSKSNFLTLLLEPGQDVELKADFDSLNYPVSISGSKGTDLMIEYNKRLRKTINELAGLRQIYLKSLGTPELPAVMDHLDSLAQGYLTELNSYTKDYINKNLTSLVSLVALYQQVAPREYVLPPEKDLKYYIKVDSALSRLYPDYEPVIALHKEVQEMVSGAGLQNPGASAIGEGAEAPEIALPDPQGDTIRLSSTRGSVVLLDFWASWCPPCRRENPNLVRTYNLYHARGFQIYQVSLDKTSEAWLKGIQDDHLEKWIHVSDIKYWNSVVVPLYGFESIPSNFLLNKDGRIIATNLRGEMLQTRLAELFNK